MTKLSIIIPTLNEAEHLLATLESLGKVHEIIVVDGGSQDVSCEIATQKGAKLVHSKKAGRAAQMNQGAKTATGEILLFIHGDTIVSPDSLESLLSAIAINPDFVGGGFTRFFDSPSCFLKISCRLANIRSRKTGLFLGDQGLFAIRPAFERLCGFRDDLPYGEDLDFSIRLRKMGKVMAIQPPVISSARRFKRRGPVVQTLIDLWLTAKLVYLRK